MSEIITYLDAGMSGETTLMLFLRNPADGTLLNTGGDALADPDSVGVFVATLAESRTGLGDLYVIICDGAEHPDNLVFDGRLIEGQSVIGESGVAELDSAGREAIAEAVNELLSTEHGLDSWEGGGGAESGGLTEGQATQLTEIHEAIYPEDPDDPPIVVTPAVGDNTTGYTTTLDADLEVQPNVTVKVQLIQLPTAAGITNSNAVRSVLSSDVGLAQMPLRKGATYRIWAGGDDKKVEVVTVPADAGGTYQLPSLVGRF